MVFLLTQEIVYALTFVPRAPLPFLSNCPHSILQHNKLHFKNPTHYIQLEDAVPLRGYY